MNSVSHKCGQGRESERQVCGFTPLSKQKQGPKERSKFPPFSWGSRDHTRASLGQQLRGGLRQPKARPERRWAGGQDPTPLGDISIRHHGLRILRLGHQHWRDWEHEARRRQAPEVGKDAKGTVDSHPSPLFQLQHEAHLAEIYALDHPKPGCTCAMEADTSALWASVVGHSQLKTTLSLFYCLCRFIYFFYHAVEGGKIQVKGYL